MNIYEHIYEHITHHHICITHRIFFNDNHRNHIDYLNGMRCDTNEKRALYKSKNEKKINVFIMFLKKKTI